MVSLPAVAEDAREKTGDSTAGPAAPEKAAVPPAPPPAEPRTVDEALAFIRWAEDAKRERPSLARGGVENGTLVNPAMLPFEGFGFAIAPRRHRGRDLRYGTDELVFGLAEVAATLARDRPGAPRLVVGNMSARAGGAIPYSHSHQNGRDADLVFFVTDLQGRPREPKDFVVIDDAKTLEGREVTDDDDERATASDIRCRLDVAREWELVEALLECRRFGDRVQRLYLRDPLRARLLAHARARAAADPDAAGRARSEALIARAGKLLSQPAHAGLHDDHLHLRIGCSEEDRREGCGE